MDRIRKRITAGLLAGAMALGMFVMPGSGKTDIVEAAEIPVRESSSDTLGENQIMVGLEGVDTTSSMQDTLDLINRIRWEACNPTDSTERVPDPRQSASDRTTNGIRYLQPSDYVPMQFGVNCQKAAVIRAAEGAVRMAHVRPNGKSCSEVGQAFGVSCAENLAWHYDPGTRMEGWIEEKKDWVEQNSGEVTGHYTSLINPGHTYVGIAVFNPVNDEAPYDWGCTSGEFESSDTAIDPSDYLGDQNETVIQKMPVLVSAVKDLNISIDSVLSVNASAKATLLVDFYFLGSLGYGNTAHNCPVYDGVTWESSDTSILSIAADGTATAKKTGTVTVTATIGTGTSAKDITRTVLVIPDGVTVTGVEDPDMVYAESYKTPVLSKTAKATLSNNSTVDVDVTWGTYDSSNLQTRFTSNEFEVTGTALGYTVTQKVHVNPAVIKRVFPEEVIGVSETGSNKYGEVTCLEVDSGTQPKNIYVGVSLSNGLTWTFQANWTSTDYVVWDQDSLNQYKKREGGDFTITGVIKLDSDAGPKTVECDVSVPLHVNPATVETVSVEDAEVTTASGTAPEYPTATVTWSNGDVTHEDITWANAEPTAADRRYMTREGGDYTLTGTYEGQSCTLTVHVTPAVPVSASIPVSERSKTVNSGTPATLIGTATVTWSNGDTTTEPVTWDAQTEEKYGKIDGNTYTVNGTAQGKTVSVNVTVLPATIDSVETLAQIETIERVAPILPTKVQVNWSNGDVTQETVAWDTIPASKYASPDETFSETGTVHDFDGKITEITAVIHVNKRKLTGIAWKTGSPQGGTSYYSYKKSDLTGTLIASFDNGETEEVALTEAMFTSFDPESTSSTQRVTITYTVNGVSKSLYHTMKLIRRTGITVSKAPDKREYIENQELDTTGLVVYETLDDKTSREISADDYAALTFSGYEKTPSGYGSQTVTVSLGEFSDTFTVSVRKKEITGMSIAYQPNQRTFVTGQPFSYTGLAANAVYDNGEQIPVTITADMLRMNLDLTEENVRAGNFGDPVSTDTVGKHKVYVRYSEKVEVDGRTGTHYVAAYYEINVLAKVVQSIEFETAPSRTEYPEGDVTFDNFSDAVLLVHNNNDYDETVPITEAEITGFDINQVDEQTVTVSYGGKTMTFKAMVREKQVTGVYAVAPTRVSYVVGETLLTAGGAVVIAYDNGTEETVAFDSGDPRLVLSFSDSSSVTAPMAEGKRKLVVTWDGVVRKKKDGSDIEIDVVNKKLTDISWKTGSPLYNTSYYTYKKEDLTGTIVASYDNGDRDEVELTPDMITVFDGDSQASTQTVTISYSYAGMTKTMTTQMKLVKKSGIKVTKRPDKTTYLEGDPLETSGIQFAWVLDNGETRDFTEDETTGVTYTGFTSRPEDSSLFGKQTITAKAEGYGFKTTFDITLKKKTMTGIKLVSGPDKTTYVEGQPLELAGLAVDVIYDNGDRIPITVTKDMLREGIKEDESGVDLGTAASTTGVGAHTIFVLYTEGNLCGWVQYDIEVLKKVVSSLEYVVQPSKTTYVEADPKFDDFGGITIRANCNNGYAETVKVTKSMISGFDLKKVGTQTVTISYGGKTLSFTATVRAKTVKKMTVTAPTKRTYTAGQKLNLNGSKITITYDNGTTATVAVKLTNKDIKVTMSPGKISDRLSIGTKTLTIKYKGTAVKTKAGTKVTVTVKKAKYSNEWVKGIYFNKAGNQLRRATLSWKKNSKGKWVQDTSGWRPKKQWVKIDGKRYYFKADGYMASSEWYRGKWFNKNGTQTYKYTGKWVKYKKGWRFECSNGWYAKGKTYTINGKKYKFNSKGYLVK